MLREDRRTGKTVYLEHTDALARDIEDLQTTYECDHPHAELMKLTRRNGAKHIQKVCPDCGGTIGQSVKRSDLDADPPEFDGDPTLVRDQRHERYLAQLDDVYQRHVEIQVEADAKGTRRYHEYLGSAEWNAKRRAVLARCSGVCEGCGTAPATQVHHLTYDNLFDELLFQLVGICSDCHAKCRSVLDELNSDDVDENVLSSADRN